MSSPMAFARRTMGPRRLRTRLAQLSNSGQVDLLRLQLGVTRRAVTVVGAMTLDEISPADARELMTSIEHEGDDCRAELVDQLARSLVTPMDREDIYRLSRSIDDILDSLRDLVRGCDLYQVNDLARFAPFLEALSAGIDHLELALIAFTDSRASVGRAVLAAKKSCNRMRRLYQEQVAELFAREITADALKERELLRTLDTVGLHLGAAGDALADGVMKRWH
ncbi:DUF47 domain-containing protein [Kitasatospora nipponensis]